MRSGSFLTLDSLFVVVVVVGSSSSAGVIVSTSIATTTEVPDDEILVNSSWAAACWKEEMLGADIGEGERGSQRGERLVQRERRAWLGGDSLN